MRSPIALYLLLIVIFTIAVMLTNGITPSVPISPSLHPDMQSQIANMASSSAVTSNFSYMLVTDTPNPNAPPNVSNQQLQLRTPHFIQNQTCFTKIAVDFLVDNSGSMLEPGDTNSSVYVELPNSKIAQMKQALMNFSSHFSDNSIVGIQTFSGPPVAVALPKGIIPAIPPKALIPIDIYANNKANFVNAVQSMRAEGATYTRDAFIFAKQQIDAAMQTFPNEQFFLIFISDGIPETAPETGGPCEPSTTRCFATSQDPTDIAAQLKAEGVHIYTIRYLDPLDNFFDASLIQMMQHVASDPTDALQAPSTLQISDLLNTIATKICQ